MATNVVWGERIMRLETQMADIQTQQTQINDKLDDLIALRNKGFGVFWVISTLFGIGIVGFAAQLFSWLRS